MLLLREQEVAGSNPVAPTYLYRLHRHSGDGALFFFQIAITRSRAFSFATFSEGKSTECEAVELRPWILNRRNYRESVRR